MEYNKKLYNKVVEEIRAKPDRFGICNDGWVDGKRLNFAAITIVVAEGKDALNEWNQPGDSKVAEHAAELLGVPKNVAFGKIFTANQWPEPHKSRIWAAAEENNQAQLVAVAKSYYETVLPKLLAA